MFKKYVKLKSLTWWAAIAEAIVNLIRATGVDIPLQVDGIIAALFGIGLRGSIGD